MSGAGEDDLIARYFAPLATHPGAFALGDDAATLSVSEGHELVVTADALVAGVHFFADDPPDAIARKALRVNLSDLAAKGAKPLGFVLSLALPSADNAWLSGFSQGLGEDSVHYGCPLLGGDTVKTPGPLTIAITAFGEVPRGTMVRRAGAKAGDVVFITGTIGDATLGLSVLRGEPLTQGLTATHLRDDLIARYRVPQPRTALADAVRAFANAAMDVSDGLAGDLAKLCAQSCVAAKIDCSKIPLSPAARVVVAAEGEAAWQRCLTGGDDYEIVGTIHPDNWQAFASAALGCGVVVTAIGTISDGVPGVSVTMPDGGALAVGDGRYQHF